MSEASRHSFSKEEKCCSYYSLNRSKLQIPSQKNPSLLLGNKPGLRSAPKKRCKTFINWITVLLCTPCSDDASVATMAQAVLCVLFKEFLESDEIGINTCLILQNTLEVTVTVLLQSIIKWNIPIK